MRNVKNVFLFPCDDGLEMCFVPEQGDSFKVTMSWPTVADLSLRIDAMGKEALTMMQVGLDPYPPEHREQFILAGLQACNQQEGPAA